MALRCHRNAAKRKQGAPSVRGRFDGTWEHTKFARKIIQTLRAHFGGPWTLLQLWRYSNSRDLQQVRLLETADPQKLELIRVPAS